MHGKCKMANSGVDYYFLRSTRDGYLLVHDNYLFQKSKVRQNKTYWRCVVRSPRNVCHARAILVNGRSGQSLILRESHNHPPDSDEIARRKFKLKMKQRLQKEGPLIPAPKVYKEEAEKAALAGEFKQGVPSYESLRRTIYSARNCSRDVTLTPIDSEDLPITTTSLGGSTNSRGSEENRNMEEDSDEDTIVSRAGSSSILCMRTESPPDCSCPSYNVCVLCRDRINDLKSARNLPEHASVVSRSSTSSPCAYLQCGRDKINDLKSARNLPEHASDVSRSSTSSPCAYLQCGRDMINDLKSARNLPEHASVVSRSPTSSPCAYLQCDSDSMPEDDPIQALTRIAQNTEKPSTQTIERKNRGLLERLRDNVIIGDGGFVFSLEKRGYVKAGPWTPEAVVEHPDAVRSLHREFLRAGSDVMQAFTFYASDDKLCNRGNEAGKMYKCADINNEACRLAKEVAAEGDALVAGGISQTPTYLSNKGKAAVQSEFAKQVEVFKKNNVDFLICEYFEHIEEMEWAIEVCKKTSLPVAATMCIGPEGDLHGVSAGQCAVRMAKAGADVVGLNCHFDPFMTLETIAIMKKALEAEGLKPYLMTQPLAFHTPDAGKQGFIDLPEFPFALEPRVCSRWDMHRYAREAYKLGVRYIGGCCGFESYHIRAVAEELAEERGKLPKSTEKHEPWGEGLKMHTKPWVRARARKDYWQNINPSTGRPFSAAFSNPDNWGVTAGSEDLKQKAESTTKEELQKVFAHRAK